MKTKIFPVSHTSLQSGQTVKTNIELFIDSYLVNGSYVTENAYYYPKQIVIDNDNEADLGFVFIADDKEDEVYNRHPEWYDFIPLNAKSQVSNSNSVKTKYVYIKRIGNTGSLTTDVVIYCIGYKK